MSTPATRDVVLALDLGGTQIRAAAVLPDGTRLGRCATETPHGRGAAAIYDACAGLLDGVRAGLPGEVAERVGAVGISSMGPVDPWRGQVVDPPNVPDLRDAPLADELEARLGLAVYLERDTNVAALAERWLGAARGCDSFLYVTVSTGLGGSIVREGRLLLGPDGTAGELGHLALMLEDGPRCGCGGIGHLEALSSGSGLVTQAHDALAAGSSPFLARRLADRRAVGADVAGRDVAEGEAAGDDACRRIMARARRAFALACVGWVNAFDPERIVVGGSLADGQGERWLGPAREAVAEEAFRLPRERVRIVPAALGADVGLVGGWPLVAERHGPAVWRERRRAAPPG